MGFRGRGYDIGGGQERWVKNVDGCATSVTVAGEGERGKG